MWNQLKLSDDCDWISNLFVFFSSSHRGRCRPHPTHDLTSSQIFNRDKQILTEKMNKIKKQKNILLRKIFFPIFDMVRCRRKTYFDI